MDLKQYKLPSHRGNEEQTERLKKKSFLLLNFSQKKIIRDIFKDILDFLGKLSFSEGKISFCAIGINFGENV